MLLYEQDAEGHHDTAHRDVRTLPLTCGDTRGTPLDGWELPWVVTPRGASKNQNAFAWEFHTFWRWRWSKQETRGSNDKTTPHNVLNYIHFHAYRKLTALSWTTALPQVARQGRSDIQEQPVWRNIYSLKKVYLEIQHTVFKHNISFSGHNSWHWKKGRQRFRNEEKQSMDGRTHFITLFLE